MGETVIIEDHRRMPVGKLSYTEIHDNIYLVTNDLHKIIMNIDFKSLFNSAQESVLDSCHNSAMPCSNFVIQTQVVSAEATSAISLTIFLRNNPSIWSNKAVLYIEQRFQNDTAFPSLLER